MNDFLENFASCFSLINSCVDKVSSDYLRGLYVSGKRNCDKMSKHIERNSQSLNHFISESPWDWQTVGVQLARLFVKMLPSNWLDDLCLSIDESGIPKKGDASVGVGHQYCGQLGKNANCQVGVYSGLVCRGFYCLINAILYLPKHWCERKDVDIPVERRTHKTKIELAYEMIMHAKNLKIPFKWVNFDSFYGRDQGFLFSLHREGIIFMGDIPSDASLYTSKPKVYIPQKKSTKGRSHTRYQIKAKSIKAETLARKISDKSFKKITIRTNKEGQKVQALFYCCTVYLAVKEYGAVLETKFLVRKDADGTIKYAITNEVKASLHRLAFMHGQRYFIERSFQDLKQQIGMNEYQLRGYAGWHRHMFMCMMGLLFIQTEKMIYLKINHAPSTPQLAELLKIMLPQKIRTMIDILNEFRSIKKINAKRNGTTKKSAT